MNANLAAFLAVIRACEGTAGPNGYRTLFGGRLFDSYADHPRIVVSTSGYKSTAAGAYQALARTWDDFVRAKGPHDFSPASQDEFALWCITRRKAMDDVIAGRLKAAITKCSNEWASLPGSPYGQPTRTLEYCEGVYRKAGGFLRPVPNTIGVSKPQTIGETTIAYKAAPESTRKVMDPISLVSMLASVFSPLLRAKVEQAVGTEVGKPLVDNLLALAKSETGQSNPMAAVGIAQENPEIVAKLEQSAAEWFSTMKPALDALDAYERAAWAAEEAGRDAASKRGLAMQEAGLVNNPQFIMAAFIMVMVAGVVFTVLYRDTFSTDMQSFVIGAIVGGALTAVISYFFGSSRSSTAKDAVISEMAARK